MSKYWSVAGHASATFYVKADTEGEALEKAQNGKYVSLEFENAESWYEEAFEVEAIPEPTVEITKAEYERLLENEDFLECLEACGVDNWPGYADACEMAEG